MFRFSDWHFGLQPLITHLENCKWPEGFQTNLAIWSGDVRLCFFYHLKNIDIHKFGFESLSHNICCSFTFISAIGMLTQQSVCLLPPCFTVVKSVFPALCVTTTSHLICAVVCQLSSFLLWQSYKPPDCRAECVFTAVFAALCLSSSGVSSYPFQTKVCLPACLLQNHLHNTWHCSRGLYLALPFPLLTCHFFFSHPPLPLRPS